MKRRPAETGSATALAVIVTAVLLIAAVALSGYAAVSVSSVLRADNKSEELERVAQIVTEAVQLLEADASPEADGRGDPVFLEFGPGAGGTAEIRDLSSLVNPNWIQTFFLGRGSLKREVLQPGVDAADLQVLRMTKGFSMTPGRDFADLLTERAMAELISPYSYMNANTAGELELEQAYYLITGNGGAAAAFRSRIKQARSAFETVTEDEMFSLLTPYYDAVFPYINAFPRYNVNHVDRRILEAILSYPAFEIPNWQSLFSALMALRGNGEVTMEQIRATLDVPDDHRVMQYLGTTTWFWELRVKIESADRVVIIARVPGSTRADDSFRVIGMYESRKD